MRGHTHRHPCVAGALIVMALLVTMLVPTQYMPGIVNGALVMRPCDGMQTSQFVANTAAMQTEASGHHASAGHQDHHKSDGPASHFSKTPCIFASLSTPALPPIDPILLALAIAFIIATVFRVVPTPVLSRGLYLRPPSQGPPAAA